MGKTMKTTTNNVFEALMVAATIAAAFTAPELALAQAPGADLAGSVDVVHGGLLDVPNIIAGIFYIGGAILIGMGLVRLMKHAENPAQAPLGPALGRIGAGIGALALPALGAWLNNTLALGINPAVSQPLAGIAGF
jgi:hypothetical protein